MFDALLKDVEAALRHDPAARSRYEVMLAYPGVHALALHRVSHWLWERKHALWARLFSHHIRRLTGIEIHPGATIADGVFIDHGMGVVIGETAIIEEGCIIYKGVVLGGTSLERKIRHPHLQRNVIVGSNACILGAIQVGEGARIGSGSVVIQDVPPGSTVVGVPGRVVKEKRRRFSEELDHATLPDPVADVLKMLAQQQDVLLNRIKHMEAQLGQPSDTDEPELSDEMDSRKKAGSIF